MRLFGLEFGKVNVMGEEWKLDPSEVGQSVRSSSSGKSGQFSRRLKLTSCTVILTHIPTGLQVQEEVSSGNYSKKEMKKLREEASQRLFSTLEKKVAKHLRVIRR